MKICVTLVLLTFLCPGGCPVYDFDLKTIEQPSQFANNLKLAADLNSEFEQGIMNYNTQRDTASSENENDELNKPEEVSSDAVEQSYNRPKFLRKAEDDGQISEMESFVGSNLFDATRKKCFSPEDVALLTSRKDFELLVPKDLPKCLMNDEMIEVLLSYFYNGNQLIEKMPAASKDMVQKAYYDMLGGYLRSYMMPVSKYSFYAGKASLKTVSNVVELFQQCKSFLNTNGNGWKEPIALSELKGLHIEPFRSSPCDKESGGPSGCSRLELLPRDEGDESAMIVSLPKLEPDCSDGSLGNIWLPFKKKRTFDLKSSKSAFVIMRFYETVTRCYQTQSLPQDAFNHKFKAWINENIQPHISDEVFYPGLGAVLRIFEKLRKGRKALDMDDGQDGRIEDYNIARHGSDVISDNDMSKSDDGFSDLELASKALEYKMQERAKQTFDNGKRWFNDDSRQMQSRKICDKPKNKTKCKSKVKAKPAASAPFGFSFTADEQKHYLKYLCCLIALILFILVVILCCAFFTRYRRHRPKTQTKPTPPKKKRRNWCDKLLCRKKPRDEEIEIKPETTSVVAARPQRRTSSSTSSLACQPTAKCIPCSNRSAKDSESAPIIETTSLDYSSSEPESKLKKVKKGKQKIVTIDEKKSGAKQSPSKTRFGAKLKPAESTSNESVKRVGIQRLGPAKPDAKSSIKTDANKRSPSSNRSKQSPSWETMYDS